MRELPGGRRASLLAYCRIEEDELTAEDEVLLETMYWAAVGYMAGAGVAAPAAGTPRRAQYDLCVNALVLDDWDFYVISTKKLDEVCGAQKTISLTSLQLLGTIRADYSGIKEAIIHCIHGIT